MSHAYVILMVLLFDNASIPPMFVSIGAAVFYSEWNGRACRLCGAHARKFYFPLGVSAKPREEYQHFWSDVHGIASDVHGATWQSQAGCCYVCVVWCVSECVGGVGVGVGLRSMMCECECVRV